MALAITDDHRSLGDVVRSFAADRQLRDEARRALDTDSPALPGVWKQIADLGWLGLHLPESLGGSGFGLAELAVVTDELGYAVSPGPFLATVTASAIVAEAGNADQRERHLPGLADGTAPAGLGLAAGLSRRADGVIDGTVPAVLGGRWASVLLLRVGEDLVILDAADPAAMVEPVTGIDPSLGLAARAGQRAAPAGRGDPAGSRPAGHRAVPLAGGGGGGRRCPSVPGLRARLREGARAVRPNHRRLPGGQAPPGQHARRRRARDRARLGREPGRVGRRGGRARRGRRGQPRAAELPRGRAEGDPALRRHRLHLGARCPPVPAPGRCPVGRRRGGG